MKLKREPIRTDRTPTTMDVGARSPAAAEHQGGHGHGAMQMRETGIQPVAMAFVVPQVRQRVATTRRNHRCLCSQRALPSVGTVVEICPS
jgi:hypothetical protein